MTEAHKTRLRGYINLNSRNAHNALDSEWQADRLNEYNEQRVASFFQGN